MNSDDRPDTILPFSGRLGDLAYRPARVVGVQTTIQGASKFFADSDIEYLVVHENRIPIGVLHKFDLVRHNMTRDSPSTTPITELMERQVVSVQKDHPVIDSLVFMIRHDLKFLLIMDDKEVVGVVSQDDWLSLQARYPTDLLHRIGHMESIDELAKIRAPVNEEVWKSFETSRDAVPLTRTVTLLNDAITRRVITLSLVEMKETGRGDPPVPFAWVGMGSEGRAEQTITTDQDNGLMYRNVEAEREAETRAWFAELAELVVSGLERCGFARCAGNVMATNPELLGSEGHWERLFSRIIEQRDDKDLFEASIYFDFRCLFGARRLVDNLHDFLGARIREHDFFLRHLVEVGVQGGRPPIGSFRWKLYGLTGIAPPPFDIKRTALMPLVAAIRVLALREGLHQANTAERLEMCLRAGRLTRAMAKDVRRAHDFLLRLRFKIEFGLAAAGKKHDHMVDIGSLLPAQARYLSDALVIVRSLQEFVYRQITGRSLPWSLR